MSYSFLSWSHFRDLMSINFTKIMVLRRRRLLCCSWLDTCHHASLEDSLVLYQTNMEENVLARSSVYSVLSTVWARSQATSLSYCLAELSVESPHPVSTLYLNHGKIQKESLWLKINNKSSGMSMNTRQGKSLTSCYLAPCPLSHHPTVLWP